MKRRSALLASLGLLVASCSGGGPGAPAADPGGPIVGGPGGGGATGSTETLDGLPLDGDGIVDLDLTVSNLFRDVFERYAAVEVPTGRIHILAQSGVDDLEIRRCREVIRQGLQDVPGSAEGADKSDVIEAMVDSRAVFAIFRDAAAIDLDDPAVAAFMDDLPGAVVAVPATHIVPEGTAAYMQTLPEIDVTFGAAALLIHRTGLRIARPFFAADLEELSAAAVGSTLFVPPSELPAAEHAAAYLAMAMDVHSGVFGHDPDGDGIARFGGASYGLVQRDELALGDAGMLAWIESFFSPHHTFPVLLPESFSGTFDCLRRPWNPYSSRSEHLRHVQMTGTNSGEILGAPFDLTLIGNDGNNNLKGRRGFDTIEGGLGFDTAVFSFPLANYDIRFEGSTVIVEDVHGGHEQIDVLTGIERLQFSDQGINL